jgi:phosphatidate cytidylyltransferase
MKRIMYGLLLFGFAISALITGGVVWPLVLGFAAFLAGEEFIRMTRAKGIHVSQRIIRGMIIAFFTVTALQEVPGLNLPWNFSIEHFPILLTIGVCISFIRLLFRHENPPASIADIATTVLGFIYLGWMPSHLVLLRNLAPPTMVHATSNLQEPGLAYVWTSLFIIWSTDVFAYYTGKFWGKHLLYPQVSPKKTVEGAIGGLIASVLMATAVVYIADNFLFPAHPFQMKLWQAPLMGAVLSVGSQLGDLCESLLKRDAGLKDSGELIPGHGGMLDRGDSLIFAAPIAYYWVCLVVLGIL